MLYLIQGDITPVNRYRLDEIKSKYLPENITSYSLVSFCCDTTKHSMLPIFGNKYLYIIEEEANYKNWETNIKRLLTYKNKENADYIWCLGKKKDISYLQETDVIKIQLNRFYKSDFHNFILKSLEKTSYIEPNLVKRIATRCNYSYNRCVLYLAQLATYPVINVAVINKVVHNSYKLSFNEMLCKLLQREKEGVKAYYQYVQSYSKRWVDEHIKKVLAAVLNYKLQLLQGKKNSTELRNNQKSSKLIGIILYTNLSEVFFLLQVLNSGLSVEFFITNSADKYPDNILNIKLTGKELCNNGAAIKF